MPPTPTQNRPSHFRTLATIGLASLALLTGCQEQDPVRVYTARIDPPAPPIQNQATPQTPAARPVSAAPSTVPNPAPAAPTALELKWQVPTDQGWTDTGESNQFRITTLRAGNPDDPASALEVAVSRLVGPPAPITANVNRWRQQLGLPPLDQREVVPQVQYATNPYMANQPVEQWFTRQQSADGANATMIAWFNFDTHSWFFKANGTPAALDAHRQAFDQLVASVRPNDDGDAGPAHDHDHTDHTGHNHD